MILSYIVFSDFSPWKMSHPLRRPPCNHSPLLRLCSDPTSKSPEHSGKHRGGDRGVPARSLAQQSPSFDGKLPSQSQCQRQ